MDFKFFRAYSDYFSLAMLLPSSILVGTVLGYYADKWLGTKPWGILIGILLGMFAGGWNFYKDYKRLTRKDNESQKD